MGAEDQLGWDYFGPDPMTSPRMQEHMDWHIDPQNQNRTGNYGERFLLFHKQYIDKFDTYRISRGYMAVTGWDPTTPIPPALSHDHPLVAPRDTDNPYAINPLCKTPTWATIAGGTDLAPTYGYTSLCEFQSLDELGRAIDSGWHGTVHNTIGGDMSQFHSPIDPVFWRWHRWIDNVRAAWETCISLARLHPPLAYVRILFGVINDAPGIVIGPDGVPIPVPGGPGDPVWRQMSPATRDVLAGLAVGEVASLISDARTRTQIEKLSKNLIAQQAQHLEAGKMR